MRKKPMNFLTKQDKKLINNYLDVIEEVTGIEAETIIQNKSRKDEIVFLRHIIMYIAHTNTRWSLQTIAEYVGLTNHTSVIHGLKRVNEWKAVPHYYKSELTLLNEIENEYAKRYPETIELSA